MNIANSDCQTPSKELAAPVGNSGTHPERYHESRFVADEAPGKLDVEHTIFVSSPRVTVCIATTRYVGTVGVDGFLINAQQHIAQGTLAPTLLLTIRARISALEVGGTLGVDGLHGLLNVEVFLNEISLGMLVGDYGIREGNVIGTKEWQDFELEVDVRHVKFPDDPCRGQDGFTPCSKEIMPVSNEITFEFTGNALSFFPGDGDVIMEVDWLTLEYLHHEIWCK